MPDESTLRGCRVWPDNWRNAVPPYAEQLSPAHVPTEKEMQDVTEKLEAKWDHMSKDHYSPPLSSLSAAGICEEAARLVAGERDRLHGDKYRNHEAIAAVWNGIMEARAIGKGMLVHPLDAHDVACLMEGLKIARRYVGAYNADDYVDAAGYAACAGEIRAKDERARPAEISAAEEQRCSFAYGNVATDNPDVTREMVDRAAEKMK